MARNNMLSCLDKRDLLNQSAVSIDKLTQWGDRYQEAGLMTDAVDFYERANALEALEKLLPVARTDGDTFLFGRILKALGREGAPEEWISVGEKAKELGKHAFAKEAFQRGGLQTVSEESGGDHENAQP